MSSPNLAPANLIMRQVGGKIGGNNELLSDVMGKKVLKLERNLPLFSIIIFKSEDRAGAKV